MEIDRVILIVLDGFGVGELPDAAEYGDAGSNTFDSIKKYKDFKLERLIELGISSIEGVDLNPRNKRVKGCYGRMKEASKGKDTLVGHWEMMGIISRTLLPTYPDGFPQEIINEFEKSIGIKVLGNIACSGTTIIQNYGSEHIKTGFPIVYTSSDSVFQVAAHEKVVNIENLYEMCVTARNIMVGEHAVGRVVARPFNGEPGNFKRTERRKDFTLEPTGITALDQIKENGFEVKAVGKIEDIFSGMGITESVHTRNNAEGIDKTIHLLKQDFKGLIFTNLVDFDMLYGHRNDIAGYAEALMYFDLRLNEIIESMKNSDLLIITSDHGCDPGTPSTDHSREYVPVLIYGKFIKRGIDLGTLDTFSDIGKTILDIFQISNILPGKSFYPEIMI